MAINKYYVQVIRTDWGYVEVEALNEEQARRLAKVAEVEGNIVWNDHETVITKVKVSENG